MMFLNDKKTLSYMYYLFSKLEWADHTYTHLSCRSSSAKENFYIQPFGFLFHEVTDDSLLEVSLQGDVIKGKEVHYNRTGYIIHASLYKKREDIGAIFHLHIPEVIAISCLHDGLSPMDTVSRMLQPHIAYHNYDSLSLQKKQGYSLADDLQDKSILFLRHHGIITCGATCHEAFSYMYHTVLACKEQCKLLARQESNETLSSNK